MIIKLVIMFVGGALVFGGFQEFQVSKSADEEPAQVAIADIEAGTADLSNAHVVIGPHMADFYGSIYEYEIEQGEEVTDASKVNYTYYPVLSTEHPFIVGLNELFEKYPDGIPDDVPEPQMENLALLVKTTNFKTVGEIPGELTDQESVQGLIVNKIEKLDEEEVELLQQSYPGLDTDKILLLEEGREPSSPFVSFGMMGGGVGLIVLGGIWLVAGFRK